MIEFFECCTQVFRKVYNRTFSKCCLEPPVISGEHLVCPDPGETILSCLGNYDTYQWYLNGVKLTGATDDTYLAAVSGSYTVKVTRSGQWKTSEAFLFTVLSNSILFLNPDYFDRDLFFAAYGSYPDYVTKDNFFVDGNKLITVSQNSGAPLTVQPCYGLMTIVEPIYGTNPNTACGEFQNYFISSPDTYNFTVLFNGCSGVNYFYATVVYDNQTQGPLFDFGDTNMTINRVTKFNTAWVIYTSCIGDVSGINYTTNRVWRRVYNDNTKAYENTIVALNTNTITVTVPGIYTLSCDELPFGAMTFFAK